jgi:hypothetical protein
MRRPAAAFIAAMLLSAGICSSQSARNVSHYIEIKLPPDVKPEGFFGRYTLADDDLGGWIQGRAGVSKYVISTVRDGLPMDRIKAVLYAPGCAIRMLDSPLSADDNQEYLFQCQPLPNVSIAGTIIHPDRLYGRGVKLEAKYMAHWAASFMDLGDNMAMEIPVGEVVTLDADGHFRMEVPDLWHDPAAGDPERDGELRILARDQTSGEMVAQLIPMGHPERKTRMGGLTIQGAYPPEIVFAPCSGRLVHNEFGFALRPDASGACDR